MKDGIYEKIIHSDLFLELRRLQSDRAIEKAGIDSGEAHTMLAHYLGLVIEKSLEHLRQKQAGDDTGDQGLKRQIELSNRIIETINQELGDEFPQPEIEHQGQILKSITSKFNQSQALVENSAPIRPSRSLTISSLFTGDRTEPSLMEEIKKEILSSDEIYLVVSFIKWSGLVLIYDELRTFSEVLKRPIYVMTTTYLGASDFKAIEHLAKLPTAKIKITYDIHSTRLHAKSYLFHRSTGFSTAYVGSSNLSKAAFTDGMEWNIKITEQDSRPIMDKMRYTFERYWNSPDFVDYDSANEVDRLRLQQSLTTEGWQESKVQLAGFDIQPYDFQRVILDMLEAERSIHGHYKNLVVAATGVGKTVISAFDYKRFQMMNPGARLLFVAHRQEILEQSIAKFREILKNPNFGEIQTGTRQARSVDHLFITIQSFGSKNLTQVTSPDFYDYIIVDEFHHAAAESYQKLLEYYQPRILLGLTATPERMDGKDVFGYFNGRIASEMRLPEAIEKRLLVPFHYFCIDDDSVDLRNVAWVNGGYSETGLYSLYERVNFRRIQTIKRSLDYYLTSIDAMKAIGFCVTVEHAELMQRSFTELGIPALSITGKTDETTRQLAKQKLQTGQVKIIFTVDVYNEGVDIPEVNTVLFLRPTQSLTVFLQQLGRGLRTSPDKDQLTVLDFVAQAHERYSFEDKFHSLLYRSRKSLYESIKTNTLALPSGSFIQMEKMAKENILKNIRSSIINRSLLRRRLRAFEQTTGEKPTLRRFLDYYHMAIHDFYGADRSFHELYHEVKLDQKITRRLKNLYTIDSKVMLEAGLAYFRDGQSFHYLQLEAMYYYSFYEQIPESLGFRSLSDGLEVIRQMPNECAEIVAILDYRFETLDFVPQKIELNAKAPLEVGSSYTTSQVLAAMGYFNEEAAPAFREGVLYLPNHKTDIFFVTLNKSDKDYSEATMYQDYYISEERFHWQSQNKVSEASPTANRYRTHAATDHDVLMFVRDHKKFGAITSPYRFIGKVKYESDQGSRPVSFVWKVG